MTDSDLQAAEAKKLRDALWGLSIDVAELRRRVSVLAPDALADVRRAERLIRQALDAAGGPE